MVCCDVNALNFKFRDKSGQQFSCCRVGKLQVNLNVKISRKRTFLQTKKMTNHKVAYTCFLLVIQQSICSHTTASTRIHCLLSRVINPRGVFLWITHAAETLQTGTLPFVSALFNLDKKKQWSSVGIERMWLLK